MEFVDKFIDFSTNLISSGGIPFGILIVMLESFLPVLPLCVFIALNISAFGLIIGVLISWIATCMGCYISYLVFYHLSNDVIYKKLSQKNKKKVERALKSFKKLSFSGLVVLITLPFTPAFLINILAGLTFVSRRRFLAALLIGKIFMVIFWGYIGKSFIESITDISAIIFILATVIIAYIISKIVAKRVNLD